MYIKIYLHYSNLEHFNNGNWVLAKTQFVGPDDIELMLNTKEVVFAYQKTGFTIRKKKWYEKYLNINRRKQW